MDVAHEVAKQMMTDAVQKANGREARFNVAYQQAIKVLDVRMDMPVWRDVVRICLSAVLMDNFPDEVCISLIFLNNPQHSVFRS